MKKTHVSVVLDANQSALLGSFIKGKMQSWYNNNSVGNNVKIVMILITTVIVLL